MGLFLTYDNDEKLNLAETYMDLQQFQRALNLLDSVLESRQNHIKALEMKNQCLDRLSIVHDNNPPTKKPISEINHVHQFLTNLQNSQIFRDGVVNVKIFPPKSAIFGNTKKSLFEPIQNYLDNEGIQLYSHQCDVIDHVRSGCHVMICTPTASGKTLAFSIPILEKLALDKNATALYLYPTKALANDQLKSLKNLSLETHIDVFPERYDGDLKERRNLVLQKSRIILSNPDMIHQHLSDKTGIQNFISRLQFVVIDEAHMYRGAFGSHVAQLIRRIRRICEANGKNPQFILATATIGNAEQFAFWLTGLEFKIIRESGAPQGVKHFLLYNPLLKKIGGTLPKECTNLMIHAFKNHLQVLCFSTTRKMAEAISSNVKRELGHSGLDRNVVWAYKGGYNPEERQSLEAQLKNNLISGIVATNALEVGIDIGSLDVVIIGGYPGSIISTWQQAGRAGRTIREAVVLFVAKEDPVDLYFMENNDYFFRLQSEEVIIPAKNEYILRDHLRCAATELPLNPTKDGKIFGNGMMQIITLDENKQFFFSEDGQYFSKEKHPSRGMNLRTNNPETYYAYWKGERLETFTKTQAFREGHLGAIILHQGHKFLVTDFNLKDRVITVEEVISEYTTRSVREVDVRILRELNKIKQENFEWCFGDIEVTERFIAFNKIYPGTDDQGPSEPINLPAIKYKTKGIWLCIPDFITSKINRLNLEAGLVGLKNGILSIYPTIMIDIRDIGAYSDVKHVDTGAPTIIFYDNIEGGIGLNEFAFVQFEEILKHTKERLTSCSCKHGCPGCILSHRFYDNKPADKVTAIEIVQKLLQK